MQSKSNTEESFGLNLTEQQRKTSRYCRYKEKKTDDAPVVFPSSVFLQLPVSPAPVVLMENIPQIKETICFQDLKQGYTTHF